MMVQKKHIRMAIVGIGALGAVYARDVARFGSCVDLFAVVRDVETYWGAPVIVDGVPLKINYRTVETLGDVPFDIVLICVKEYELAEAVVQIKHIVIGNTLVGAVTCGVDAETTLASVFSKANVFSAVPSGSDVIRIRRHVSVGNKGCLYVGSLYDSLSKTARLKEVFSSTGIKFELCSDIKYAIWRQFMFDLAIGQTAFVNQHTYGEFLHDQRAVETSYDAMEEIVSLANRIGVNIGFTDIAECSESVKKMSATGRPCILQDYWVDRKLETEALCDKAVSLAKKLNVPFGTNNWLREQIQKMVVRGNLKSAEGQNSGRLGVRVSFVPATDLIAQQLRADILKGKFAPGAKLKETELAQRFEVSRSSVRTALQTITDEGLLKALPNGRREVVEITEKQISDLFEFRLLLENNAVQTIIARPETDLTLVHNALDEIELKYRYHKDSKDWNELDILFHGSIVNCCKNMFLLNSFYKYAPLWYTLTNFQHPLRQENGYALQFYDAHIELYKMLASRDKNIFATLSSHIESGKEEAFLINGFGKEKAVRHDSKM